MANDIFKFCGKMACLSDYFLTGQTNRTIDKMDARSCIDAYKSFGNSLRYEDPTQLWDRLHAYVPAIKIAEIEEIASKWDIEKVCKAYMYQVKEIKATENLNAIYEYNGSNIKTMIAGLEEKIFTLLDRLEYRSHMPVAWVEALCNINNTNITYKELKTMIENKDKELKEKYGATAKYKAVCDIWTKDKCVVDKKKDFSVKDTAIDCASNWMKMYAKYDMSVNEETSLFNVYIEDSKGQVIWGNGQEIKPSKRRASSIPGPCYACTSVETEV